MGLARDFIDKYVGIIGNCNNEVCSETGSDDDEFISESINDPFDFNDIYIYNGKNVKIQAINAYSVTIISCDANGTISDTNPSTVVSRDMFVRNIDWKKGQTVLRNYPWGANEFCDVLVSKFTPSEVTLARLDRNDNPLQGNANLLIVPTNDFYSDLVTKH